MMHGLEVGLILEQIDAKGIIKNHLEHSIHRNVPITCKYYSTYPGHPTVCAAFFEAVVSAESRHKDAFRWPLDDSWVRVIRGQVAFHEGEPEFRVGRCGMTELVLQRVHACGMEMASQDPVFIGEQE